MGWSISFFVIPPKTGLEVRNYCSVIGKELASHQGGKDFALDAANEIWSLFEKGLIEGKMDLPGRDDGAVCPHQISQWLRLLENYIQESKGTPLSNLDILDLAQWDYLDENGLFPPICRKTWSTFCHRIGAWGKYGWIYDFFEFGMGRRISVSENVCASEYECIDLFALDLVLRAESWVIDLSNIKELSDQQLELILKKCNQSFQNVIIGLSSFPKTFWKNINLENFRSVFYFTKPVSLPLDWAKDILANHGRNFVFLSDSTDPEVNEILNELRRRQTLDLCELDSMLEEMKAHFQQEVLRGLGNLLPPDVLPSPPPLEDIPDISHSGELEVPELLNQSKYLNQESQLKKINEKVMELIASDGESWIESKRDMPVFFVAEDASPIIEELGIDLLYEIKATMMKSAYSRNNQLRGELCTETAIKYYVENKGGGWWGGGIDQDALQSMEKYYWLQRAKMEKTGFFRGDCYSYTKEEYMHNDACDSEYNSTAIQDESFLAIAKHELSEGNLIVIENG